jgi:hypothetical protein
VDRLQGENPSPDAIEAVAQHGRVGLMELFRLFDSADGTPQRTAAARALASLWAEDQLIAEEEKAIVRRGLSVEWRARRRYPRALKSEIPISIQYGLPFLDESGRGISSQNLVWSHRIVGARRAGLEELSAARPGHQRVEFGIFPVDFESNGPHKLVLQPSVQTQNLTETWKLDLPHTSFSFEFDARLDVNALLAMPDEARGGAMQSAIRLRPRVADEAGRSSYLPLNDLLAIRNPPQIVVSTPLPCDLAHAIELEFEGEGPRFPAGFLILGGQGYPASAPLGTAIGERLFNLESVSSTRFASAGIDRPGTRRMRVRLTPDPERGWGDPDVRSIWPSPLETGWIDVEIVRR